MIEKIQMFKQLVENPISQGTLKKISSFCDVDGKSRLIVALELYSNVRDDACTKCKLAERLLLPILKAGAKTFNTTDEKMRNTFKDPYWRQGLASVVKGLAHFGVPKPFVPGAPFQVVWEVTGTCNLKCKHCSANAGTTVNDLTTQEALEAINKLAKMGVTIVA